MGLGRKLLSENNEGVRIDLSPMIDCVFILLIFFIVTTVFVEETGITVNKPNINDGSLTTDTNDCIELEITSSGAIKYHQRNIGVDGVHGIVKQLLTLNPEVPVLIKSSQNAPHALFAEVYGNAKQAGAQKISFK